MLSQVKRQEVIATIREFMARASAGLSKITAQQAYDDLYPEQVEWGHFHDAWQHVMHPDRALNGGAPPTPEQAARQAQAEATDTGSRLPAAIQTSPQEASAAGTAPASSEPVSVAPAQSQSVAPQPVDPADEPETVPAPAD